MNLRERNRDLSQGAEKIRSVRAQILIGDKIENLKEIAAALLREIKVLEVPRVLDVKQGIKFYEEVERFEISLIVRALEETGGHQTRAAQLLGMNVTTLNSKIKHYCIAYNNGEEAPLATELFETEQ
jgi:DNA-binding protein Fis